MRGTRTVCAPIASSSKLLLKYMQKYLPEGYLVRITGEDGVARYAPLARMPETIKFDVVVSSAPAGPDEKQRTWALVAQMTPLLKEAGPEVWAELVKYSPFPDAVSTKLSQVFAAQAAKAEAGAGAPGSAPLLPARPGVPPAGLGAA